MKNWTFVYFLLFCMNSFAQPKDVITEEIEGKKYFVHIVQSGNSLWGIHVLYNTPVDEIVLANPGVENGIKDGQKIIIPFHVRLKNLEAASNIKPSNSTTHTVQAQETLYGISKKYNITIDQLKELNPEVEKSMKIGMVLILPTGSIASNEVKSTRIVFSDTIIDHVVLSHETMYSISKRFMVPVEDIQAVSGLKNNKIRPGDVIKIPVKNEKIQKNEIREVKLIELKKIDSTLLYFKAKEEYSIALLLPFFLDKGAGHSEHVSSLATEFYMGAKLAIDSLQKIGLNAKFYIFDSQNDTNTINGILKKPELLSMDMIIGPLFPDKMKIVANWCREKNIRFVCPVSSNTEILKENPFVYAAIPSDITLIEGAAKYLLKRNSKEQIILVKPLSEKDILLYERFRESFLTLPFNGTRPKLIETTLLDFKTYIKKGGDIILVIPSTDEATSKKFMNALISSSSNVAGDFTVFGTKEWQNFEDINGAYKNKYKFHFSAPNDFNYTYENTKSLNKTFRKTYNADMTKMSVQGYDVMLYFGMKYLLNKEPSIGVMSNFNMTQKGKGNGFENSNVFILQQQDFEIVKVADANE